MMSEGWVLVEDGEAVVCVCVCPQKGLGIEEMSEGLKVSGAEDVSSIPSTHYRGLTAPRNPRQPCNLSRQLTGQFSQEPVLRQRVTLVSAS